MSDPYADLDRIVRALDATPAEALAGRAYRIGDESDGPPDYSAGWTNNRDEPVATVVLTWADLAEANERETMAEIALLAVGERTVLGQCDPIERLS